MIAVRERPLMLDCRVQGEEPVMVTWRKNGVPLLTSPRVQVLANGTLFIQSFQKRRVGSDGDMGEYDCAAQNHYGMLVSRKAKVLLACKCLTVLYSTWQSSYPLCLTDAMTWALHSNIVDDTWSLTVFFNIF